jgi:hypothetical protein
MIRTLDQLGDGESKAGTKVEPKEATSTPKSRRLLCVACGNPVTTTLSRTEVSGQHHHVFCNPAGLVFEIGCFREAPGAAAAGPPENFFSWFPGYAWRVAICRNCLAHLGWAYGEDDFWGLILDRLVEEDED